MKFSVIRHRHLVVLQCFVIGCDQTCYCLLKLLCSEGPVYIGWGSSMLLRFTAIFSILDDGFGDLLFSL